MEDYEKQKKALKKAMKDVAKKSRTKVAESLSTEAERKGSLKCKLAYKVFDEALEMYEDGTLEWDEMIEDISSTLKAVGDMKDDDMSYDSEEEE